MLPKCIVMKKLCYFFVLLFLFSGCMFLKPDYLKIVTPSELKQIQQRQDIFLVDVHTPEQRHIKGTDLFVPYNHVEEYTDQLPQDKNSAIYLYCESGPMANAAARTFYELGYRNLYNLKGGADAWREQGFEFE